MPESRLCLKFSSPTVDHHESRIMVWMDRRLSDETLGKLVYVVTFGKHNGREYTRSDDVVNIFSLFPLCESTRCVSWCA